MKIFPPFLRSPVRALAGVASAFLFSGCGTLPGLKASGQVGKQEYEHDRHPVTDRGRIAVFFDSAYKRCRPGTQWRLVNSAGPLPWHSVTDTPAFCKALPDTYGLQFQLCEDSSRVEAPPSGTVTVLEKRRLKVPIYYR